MAPAAAPLSRTNLKNSRCEEIEKMYVKGEREEAAQEQAARGERVGSAAASPRTEIGRAGPTAAGRARNWGHLRRVGTATRAPSVNKQNCRETVNIAQGKPHLRRCRGCGPPAAPPCGGAWPQAAAAPPQARCGRGWPPPGEGAAGCRWTTCGRRRPVQGGREGQRGMFTHGCTVLLESTTDVHAAAVLIACTHACVRACLPARNPFLTTPGLPLIRPPARMPARTHLEAAALHGGWGQQLAHGVGAVQACTTLKTDRQTDRHQAGHIK